MKRFSKKLHYGMTLIELSVVLLVLVALAGLAVPYISGTGQMAMCQATDATLQAVKEAIMGGAAGNGYYADTLGAYPSDRGNTDYNLKYLFVAGDGNGSDWQKFNPQTGVGWRGPYLMNGSIINGVLDDSYNNVYSSSNSTGTVHTNIKNDTGPQVFDAWHRPIVLQIPENCSISLNAMDCARLVSAGPGSGIGPGDAQINTPINDESANNRRDDRVLFLKIPDPKAGGNTPCNEL